MSINVTDILIRGMWREWEEERCIQGFGGGKPI